MIDSCIWKLEIFKKLLHLVYFEIGSKTPKSTSSHMLRVGLAFLAPQHGPFC